MRVLFDARPGSSPTGIGRYAREIARLLRAGLPGHQAWSLGAGADVELLACSPIEEELELPALLEREEIECLHSPLFHLPALLPCRSIVTLHDAIPSVRPDLTSPEFARLFEQAADAAARADAVVCPSESAKRDVVKTLGVRAEKVHVVPEFAAAEFKPCSEEEARATLARLDVTEPYILSVGSIERRKNPGLILDALAQLSATGKAPLALFVGPEAGFDLAGEAARRCVTARVRYLGRVDDKTLAALYSQALALVFPSLIEGFGLPILEAFACGAPVVASNVTSIPEVAGDAALLISPDDPSALAAAIRDLIDSPERTADLRARGAERAKLFTTARTAAALSALYTHVEARAS